MKDKGIRLKERLYNKIEGLEKELPKKEINSIKRELEKEDKLDKEVRSKFNVAPKEFWDKEAGSWQLQIHSAVREIIRKELLKRTKLGSKNLAIGAGSYPYVDDSVALDISYKMLKAEPVKFKKKIQFDIEKGKLPFKDNSFDSVTMVFVVNYIKNLEKIFLDIKRILKENGNLIIVQSKKITPKYEDLEVKKMSNWKLKSLLRKLDFKINIKKIKVDKKILYFIETVF